jgi:predicted RNase H-like nuclease
MVAGVDGCRGGWVAAFAAFSARGRLEVLYLALFERFADVLRTARRAVALAVDIPIGLLETARPGGRDCDRLARSLLAAGKRQASVFTPPARAALAARDYRDAERRNGLGLSRQAFNILPRIREVDRLMSPHRQRRVFEAHPELAFLRLAGRPLSPGKKSPRGRERRLRWLARYYGLRAAALRALATGIVRRYGRRAVALDDTLDALALAVTAHHIARATAQRLPVGRAPRDRRGLRMQIVY